MVFRIFTEKKKSPEGYDKNLLEFIKENISLEPDTELRLFTRYDFDGLLKEEFDIVCDKILNDQNNLSSFVDYLPLMSDWRYFAIKPGELKFNENEEYIRQSVKACGITKNYKLQTAKIISLSNIISDSKFEEIKTLLVNPDFTKISETNKPLSIVDETADYGIAAVPDDFTEMNDIQIYQYLNKTALKMPKEVLIIVRDYFKSLKRKPTLVELFAIDSCYCAKAAPEKFKFNEINFEEVSTNTPLKITVDEFINMREQAHFDKTGAISLQDIAMAGYDYMKQKGQIQDIFIGEDNPLIQIPVDVNGVIEQYLIGFKASKAPNSAEFDMFPENHKNAQENLLEAYQALDIDCRPLINKSDRINKKSTYENTTAGDAVTKKIARQNKMLGIPTVLGNEIFSTGVKKSVNFCATAFAGANISSNSKLAEGDIIVMLGSKMKADDFATEKFSQVNNDQIKAKIDRFFKTARFSNIIKKAIGFDNGIASAVSGLKYGVNLDINRIVSTKYLGYSFIALSVPNQRAAVIVENKNVDKIKDICKNIGLSSHIIGDLSADPYLIIKNGKKQVANISTEFLSSIYNVELNSVLISDFSDKKVLNKKADEKFDDMNIKEAFLNNLRDITVSSKKGISSQFDSTVGGGCVLSPYGGMTENTPCEASVCKIPTESGNTSTVTAITYGCNPKMTETSPYHGAAFSIMECLSKIVAVGANSINAKLAICQNVSDPEHFPSKWSNAFSSLFGAFATEIGMNIPAVSYECNIDDKTENNIDFSCFAMALSKSNEIISPEFKSSGSTVILIPMPTVHKTGLPDYDKAKVMYRQIHYLSQNGKVLSAGVVNDGGISAVVAKMSFGNSIGVEFENLDKDLLFAPLTASIVVETKNPGAFSGMDTVIIGQTIDEPKFVFEAETVSINDALSAFSSPMQSIYPTKTSQKIPMTKIEPFKLETRINSSVKHKRPKVIIPVFSTFAGANDCMRAFNNAGGEAEIFFVNTKNFNNSAEELSAKINNSQILCLASGGYSEYARKLGKIIMKNSFVSTSVMNLIQNDGLILGIEEGFDILLDCGLLTLGRYKFSENGAYISDNINAVPASGFAKTKVISNKSPWLALCDTGDVYNVALSHSKGRFVVDEPTMLSLMNNKQIATIYVDKNLKPASKMPFNPDGSFCAVEGITSPDGRIFGKTGQSQRRFRNCFTNIYGNKDQRIFEAGIKYFTE